MPGRFSHPFSVRAPALLLALVLLGCLVARETPAAQALAVSPVLYDYEIAPGTSKQGTIMLVNDTERQSTFSLEVKNFVALGEDGAQEYLDEETPTDLASWISVDQPTINLGPGESGQFPFIINVPKDAEPGGHYASVFFYRKPAASAGTGVGVAEKIGVLILVSIPGNVREDARIESFTIQGSNVRSHLPVYFDLRLRNLGSVHFRPRGSLVIRNVFGRVVQRVSANPKNAAVLPNSVRRVESVWANTLDTSSERGFWEDVKNEWRNFAFGRYRATAEIAYGSQANQLVSSSVTFWVIPWRLLLIAAGALLILIILVKLYNRLLIRTALKKDTQQRQKTKARSERVE